MWLTLLPYSFYCGGLEPNPQYLQETPVYVLVSYHCYKKLLQMQWLKTTQMYYLIVLEVTCSWFMLMYGKNHQNIVK